MDANHPNEIGIHLTFFDCLMKRFKDFRNKEPLLPLLCLDFAKPLKIFDSDFDFPEKITMEHLKNAIPYCFVVANLTDFTSNERDPGILFGLILSKMKDIGYCPSGDCDPVGLSNGDEMQHCHLCLIIEWAIVDRSLTIEELCNDLKRLPRSFFILKTRPDFLDKAASLWLSKFPISNSIPEVTDLMQDILSGQHVAFILARAFPMNIVKDKINVGPQLSNKLAVQNYELIKPVATSLNMFVIPHQEVSEQLLYVFLSDLFHATRSSAKKFVKLEHDPVIDVIPPLPKTIQSKLEYPPQYSTYYKQEERRDTEDVINIVENLKNRGNKSNRKKDRYIKDSPNRSSQKFSKGNDKNDTGKGANSNRKNDLDFEQPNNHVRNSEQNVSQEGNIRDEDVDQQAGIGNNLRNAINDRGYAHSGMFDGGPPVNSGGVDTGGLFMDEHGLTGPPGETNETNRTVTNMGANYTSATSQNAAATGTLLGSTEKMFDSDMAMTNTTSYPFNISDYPLRLNNNTSLPQMNNLLPSGDTVNVKYMPSVEDFNDVNSEPCVQISHDPHIVRSSSWNDILSISNEKAYYPTQTTLNKSQSNSRRFKGTKRSSPRRYGSDTWNNPDNMMRSSNNGNHGVHYYNKSDAPYKVGVNGEQVTAPGDTSNAGYLHNIIEENGERYMNGHRNGLQQPVPTIINGAQLTSTKTSSQSDTCAESSPDSLNKSGKKRIKKKRHHRHKKDVSGDYDSTTSEYYTGSTNSSKLSEVVRFTDEASKFSLAAQRLALETSRLTLNKAADQLAKAFSSLGCDDNRILKSEPVCDIPRDDVENDKVMENGSMHDTEMYHGDCADADHMYDYSDPKKHGDFGKTNDVSKLTGRNSCLDDNETNMTRLSHGIDNEPYNNLFNNPDTGTLGMCMTKKIREALGNVNDDDAKAMTNALKELHKLPPEKQTLKKLKKLIQQQYGMHYDPEHVEDISEILFAMLRKACIDKDSMPKIMLDLSSRIFNVKRKPDVPKKNNSTVRNRSPIHKATQIRCRKDYISDAVSPSFIKKPMHPVDKGEQTIRSALQFSDPNSNEVSLFHEPDVDVEVQVEEIPGTTTMYEENNIYTECDDDSCYYQGSDQNSFPSDGFIAVDTPRNFSSPTQLFTLEPIPFGYQESDVELRFVPFRTNYERVPKPIIIKNPKTVPNGTLMKLALKFSVLPSIRRIRQRGELEMIIDGFPGERLVFLVSSLERKLKGLYILDPEDDKITRIWGKGPTCIMGQDCGQFFKYDTSLKDFTIIPTRHYTQTTDAVSLKRTLEPQVW